MTDLSEHDRYVTKINDLIETDRDELVDELADEYHGAEASGREVFWGATRSGGWRAATKLDGGEPSPSRLADAVGGVVVRLPTALTVRWHQRDLPD